uniref:Phosphatidylinositol N-acetylglucosaminyltransferase subunit C n=1 Tax=Cacopsylla melanoneura TaxID=428564 RepID=A0A8D8WQ99_9HEMI
MGLKNRKQSKKQPWKKILYGNLDYPDNYTDESFLEELKKNIHIRNVNYFEAFMGASLVTEQICLLTIFMLTYMFLLNNWIDLDYLFVFNIVNFIVCYLAFFINTVEVLQQLKFLASFILLFMLSPVLKSLTETISTDTIYACSAIMSLVHLLLNDYTRPLSSNMKLIVSNSLSLNSIVFCSVCLASRLSTNYHVFLLLLNTVQFFVLYPYVFTLYKCYVQRCILLIFCLVLLYRVCYVSVFYMFCLCIMLINIVCPFWFVQWYTYKHNIYGPWDEATISLNTLNFNQMNL